MPKGVANRSPEIVDNVDNDANIAIVEIWSEIRSHSGEKLNKCNQCNYASIRARDFKGHLKTHNGEVKQMQPVQCNNASADTSNSRMHLKIHITNVTTEDRYLGIFLCRGCENKQKPRWYLIPDAVYPRITLQIWKSFEDILFVGEGGGKDSDLPWTLKDFLHLTKQERLIYVKMYK